MYWLWVVDCWSTAGSWFTRNECSTGDQTGYKRFLIYRNGEAKIAMATLVGNLEPQPLQHSIPGYLPMEILHLAKCRILPLELVEYIPSDRIETLSINPLYLLTYISTYYRYKT